MRCIPIFFLLGFQETECVPFLVRDAVFPLSIFQSKWHPEVPVLAEVVVAAAAVVAVVVMASFSPVQPDDGMIGGSVSSRPTTEMKTSSVTFLQSLVESPNDTVFTSV